MAVNVAALIEAKYVENTQSTQYTALAVKALIDKFDVTNQTSSAVTLSVNIVASGGSASASNRMLNNKTIAAGETYPCPEIVGQTLEVGDFISALAGTASALVVRASGRVIS